MAYFRCSGGGTEPIIELFEGTNNLVKSIDVPQKPKGVLLIKYGGTYGSKPALWLDSMGNNYMRSSNDGTMNSVAIGSTGSAYTIYINSITSSAVEFRFAGSQMTGSSLAIIWF